MSATKSSKKLKAKASEDDAHIPATLRDPVIELTPAEAYSGNLPTIFVGVVDEDYSRDMWMRQADRFSRLFNFDMDNWGRHIMVNGDGCETIDAEQMGHDMSEAIDLINNFQQQCAFAMIRIVRMGIHSTIGLNKATEALVKGWNLEWGKKVIQFIALGDSESSHYLNFCKALCLQKICAKVQFYKTMDYDQFGYFQDHPHHGLTPEQLEKLLASSQIAEKQKPGTSK